MNPIAFDQAKLIGFGKRFEDREKEVTNFCFHIEKNNDST